MSVLKNLSLQQKFSMVGAACAALLALSLIASVYGAKKMVSGFTVFANRDQAIALALRDMYAQGLQAEQATRNILLNPTDEKAMSNYTQARADFDKAYGVIAAKDGDLPEVKSVIEEVMGIWKEANALQEQVQSLAKEGKGGDALKLLVKEETPKWREVRSRLMKLGEERIKVMNKTKEEVITLSNKALGVSLALGLFALVVSVLLMSVLVIQITRSIRNMRDMMQRVTTTWDLTNRLEIATGDELGELAADFNMMTEQLAEMVKQVGRTGNQLSQVSADIQQVSKQVVNAVEVQSAGVNDTSTAMVQVISSINEVANGVTVLSSSASETASSILEMAASVEEVAQNSESLSGSVEAVSSSMIEFSAAIKQVSSSVGNLLVAANTTSSSIMEMDGSIKEVKKNALDSAAISEEVRVDAETGQAAVQATMAGIQEIKRASDITAEVISSLSERADNIGDILSVIDGLSQQTNLLALNAAIIAAQAGENGKGFAVVAEEIKELSDRTSSSTREIAKVIQGVQEETKRAVAAIGKAERSIEQGQKLSQESEESLAKIVAGVQRSSAQIDNIARATAQHAGASNMIREAMEQVSDMVKQIANATREQTHGVDLIMAALEKMKGLTMQVKGSTREQSNTAGLISESTESITSMIQRINRACMEQRQGGEQIAPAIENIKLSTDSNLDAVKLLDDAFANLAGQLEMLGSEIGRFKVETAA